LRYTNENESLAGEYTKFILTSKQLESLSKQYQELESSFKAIEGVNKGL
jgi:hypothetical protein